jgi:hypothetical protein
MQERRGSGQGTGRNSQFDPDQTNSRLDVLMARADLTLIDKVAANVKTGVGAILDFVLKAKGCIAARFDSDETLQQALVRQGEEKRRKR